MKKERVIYFIIVGLLVFLAVLLDQLTKLLVVKNMLLLENIKIIPNFFHLEYITNSGAAWGMFAGNSIIILGMPFVAIILFIVLLYFSNFKEKKLLTISLILMLGGTIGNYIDRIFLGYVVDFLSFRFGSYHYPNFNVADSMLVVGAIILFIDIIIIDYFKNKKVNDIDE